MKNFLLFISVTTMLTACMEKQKNFAGISSGMTKEEVLRQVGEPSKKNDILLAELWVYDKAGRTIVFRKDTVYEIITSANARADSISESLKEAGKEVKDKLKTTGDTIDSAALRIKNKIMGDTSRKH